MKLNTAIAVLAASLTAMAATAQDEETPAEEAEQPAQAAQKPANNPPPFTTLPFCRLVEQPAEVKKPSGEWEPAEEGKFYPLGSSYRTRKGGKLTLSFGRSSSASIEGESSFGTRPQAIGTTSRTVVLAYGTVALNLADNLPEGMFFIAAPGFAVRNLAGSSRCTYETTPNGDRATVRCVTGSLGISGRHFDIASMRAADEIVITSEHDYLSTILEGTSGDYVVKVDQGVRSVTEVDDSGAMQETVAKEYLDWHLSPKTKVIINRAVPAVGERMGVHTMAFDAVGELQSDRVFCEGRAEINSGEKVVKAASGEDLAKRAAEAAETTEEAVADDASAEGDSADEASSDSSGSESDE